MSLTFGIETTRELFEKLKRDAAALKEEVSSDNFFNFVVTGYSMIDWVKNDPTVPAKAKEKQVIDALYQEHWLKVCGDLAIAVKHFKLTSRNPITSSADSAQGFGVGRFGHGGFGVGEESIEVTLNDGTSFNCLDLVQGVVNKWESFLSAYKI
jgi:hypothetical protein